MSIIYTYIINYIYVLYNHLVDCNKLYVYNSMHTNAAF